jgi:fructose-bisphosphate aldolase class II
MVDGGAMAYDRNVAVTADATALLQSQGLAVEAELGYVGGKDSQVSSAHSPGVRTDPRQAAEFVSATGVDALAVAVGSSHAMTSRTAELDVELIAALHEAVPVPLVLHGSSGVPDDALRAAVRAGIAKVNIGTALNIAYTGALRSALAADDAVDPRRALRSARSAVADAVAHLLDVVSG